MLSPPRRKTAVVPAKLSDSKARTNGAAEQQVRSTTQPNEDDCTNYSVPDHKSFDSHLKASNTGRLFSSDNAPFARLASQASLQFILKPLRHHRLYALTYILTGFSSSPPSSRSMLQPKIARWSPAAYTPTSCHNIDHSTVHSLRQIHTTSVPSSRCGVCKFLGVSMD